MGDAAAVGGLRSPAWWVELDVGGLVIELRCPDPRIDPPALWQHITAVVLRLDVADRLVVGTLRSWEPA